MCEVIGGAEKLQRQFLRVTMNGIGGRVGFESLLEDAFDAVDVD